MRKLFKSLSWQSTWNMLSGFLLSWVFLLMFTHTVSSLQSWPWAPSIRCVFSCSVCFYLYFSYLCVRSEDLTWLHWNSLHSNLSSVVQHSVRRYIVLLDATFQQDCAVWRFILTNLIPGCFYFPSHNGACEHRSRFLEVVGWSNHLPNSASTITTVATMEEFAYFDMPRFAFYPAFGLILIYPTKKNFSVFSILLSGKLTRH